MSIPQIQIHQQPSILSIVAELGSYSIEQPRAEQTIRSTTTQLNIRQPVSTLEVDQKRAWKAYNGGPALEMNQQIYSQLSSLFLQGIARRMQEGHQMASIHIPGNTIANIKGKAWDRDDFVEFRGPASFDNVDIRFDLQKAEYQYVEGSLEIDVQVRRPEVEYTRGRLDIAVQQYAKVEITPPSFEQWMG
ncbi:DUF6470 family protein [Paenibacillus taichungensis]|uniref:DUF6470 family protein n=1 Tax=Paenibacillus taichungensis TaxID=484184 RepID=UPI0035D55A19